MPIADEIIIAIRAEVDKALADMKKTEKAVTETEKNTKKLSATLIDMVLIDHEIKTESGNKMVSWNRNILKTAAINAIIAAQMAIVKILTWSK